MKKIVKRCLITVFLITTFAVVLFASYFAVCFLKYQKIPLNTESLTSPAVTFALYDIDNNEIDDENMFSGKFCALSDIPQHTKDAFISIEDKEFYRHKGINKKRMIKAMLTNLKSGRIKEGASTISQQLIKNTHLSNEKTYERKLKEIALTLKLEKKFSKDEILESYLNVIYFGNSCYGIESASNYYFNKSASELDLNESATLAGLIKASTKYCPISHYENAFKRRNLVLSEMCKDGKITIDEKIKTQNEPIKLDVQRPHNRLNSYSQATIDECAKILGMTTKQLATSGFKIHTYQNSEKQKALKTALDDVEVSDADKSAIVIDSQSGGISAYYGDSNFKLLDIKRQPASTLKPLLVYAPALNENAISPQTQILDAEIKIGQYKPTNVNKKFSGYVSVTDAVKNSINIPAIKVLSYIGIDTGKQYAEKLGITFDEADNSFTLALGGMTYGVTLRDLASAYTVFANHGEYSPATFVQYITDANNKLIYFHKPTPQMVFREDSAYLMTEILKETAQKGTARKLSAIQDFEVASKTGTAGKSNGNTDAYNIAYTPEEVVGVWFGNLSNKPISVAGGNQPTEVARKYLSTQTFEKTTFDKPSSVVEMEIDGLEKQENHRIVLASPYSPKYFVETALFSRFNPPNEVSTNFVEPPKVDANCFEQNGQIVLEIDAKDWIEYKIYKDKTLCQTINSKAEKLTFKFSFSSGESEIKVVASYANDKNSLSNEKTFLMKKVAKPKSKWYI